MEGVPSLAVGGGGGNSSYVKSYTELPAQRVGAGYGKPFQTKGFWAGRGSQDTVPQRGR